MPSSLRPASEDASSSRAMTQEDAPSSADKPAIDDNLDDIGHMFLKWMDDS